MDHPSTAQSCATGQQSAQLPGLGQGGQQGSTNIDTLIQNALQAGVPPQQLLQFLQSNLQAGHAAASPSPATTIPGAAAQQAASIQQQQQLQQQLQHATSQANNTNGNSNSNNSNCTQHSNYQNSLGAFQQQLVAQHQVAAAAAAAAAQQNQTSSTATPQPHQQQQQMANAHSAAQQQQHHQQLVQQAAAAANQQASHTPTQHQQLQQLAAVAAASAAANGTGVTTGQAPVQQTQAAGTTVPSLAWPIFQPTVSIPFFDMATYQKVNLDVQPSSMANGMDLPLNDINTLRFFFNFGVQHARAILLRQHIQSQSGQNQPQQQLALLQAAQNAAMATAAQQQQQQNQQAQQQQHQHDQYLLQQNMLKAQNEYNPSAGGGSSTQPNTQKTSIGGNPGSGGSATDRANVAAAAAVAAFQKDMTSSMSINALQNTLAHQMAAKIGGANQTQVHHSSGGGFKPLIGGGGSDHLEALWLQNALMGGGGVGGLAAQLRAHPALQASPHLQSAFGGTNAAAAVQQLFLQQQQQLAAAQHAAQQQQVQTSINDSVELIRPQAINPLNNSSSIASSLTSSNPLNSTNGLYSTAGVSAAAGPSASSQTTNSSSPKPPIPVDPAPRKTSIMPQAFQAQLGDIKQKGLTALRSPEAMNENLQKSIAAMAAAMNVSLNVPISAGSAPGTKSPAANSVVSSNVAQSPSRSPSTAADRSSQAPTLQQPMALAGNFSLAAQLSAAMLAGHNWPAHSLTTSAGGSAAGGGVTRSLTSGTSGLLSQSPGQQMSGNEQQQQMNGLSILAHHHQQQQEQHHHGVAAGLLAPEIENAPNLLSATEMHYTETFKRAQGAAAYNYKKNSSPRPCAAMSSAEAQRQRKSGVYMLSMDTKEEDGQKKKASGQPADKQGSMQHVSTTAMMNYMNNMLTPAKTQLQSQGMGLCFDESGRPIDFSSRPIDPIFRKAREHLDHQRDYIRLDPVNTLSNSSSDPSVHDSTVPIGGDLGLLSRTSGCLIGISAERLKSLSTAAAASSLAGGLAFSPIAASCQSDHERSASHTNPIAIKSGASSTPCSSVASSSNSLTVGIAKPSPKPYSSQVRAAKRRFEVEENSLLVDSQNGTEENLNVEELSPPASHKAKSNGINTTASTISGFNNLTSSALLSAALQKQQNLAAVHEINDNVDVVVTETCAEEGGLVEVVDSGKVARSMETSESTNEENFKKEVKSGQTTQKFSSSPANVQLAVDDLDDGEDSSPGGKRLRIASFSSVDDGDV